MNHVNSRYFSALEAVVLLIALPAIGFSIPLLIRLPFSFGDANYLLSFVVSVASVFVNWFLCRQIFFFLRNNFRFNFSYTRFLIVFLTLPASLSFAVNFGCLYSWFDLFLGIGHNYFLISVAVTAAMMVIMLLYEVIFLYGQNGRLEQNNIELIRSSASLQLGVLKSRIDPHFLYNSLSVLQNLIAENPQQASQFNSALTQLYYAVSRESKFDFIPLTRELEMLDQYWLLMGIRFENGIVMEIHKGPGDLDQYLVPPFSLQILIENACKHNITSSKRPLHISVNITDEWVSVSNPIRLKRSVQPGSKTGLKVLSDRFLFLTNRKIEISNNSKIFEVRLPLKKNLSQKLVGEAAGVSS